MALSANETLNGTLLQYEQLCSNVTNFVIEIKLEERICYLYIMLPITIVGFILNIISIKIFNEKTFNTIAFKYMRFMTYIDLFICCLLLIYCISTYTIPFNNFDLYLRQIYLVYIYIPLANIASNLTMLITIAVTIERLVAVKWPTKKYKLFQPTRFYTSIVCICAIAVIFNGIYFFLYKIKCKLHAVPNDIVTKSQLWIIYGYLKEVLMRIVPIIFLVIANAMLIYTVKLSRARMSSKTNGKSLQVGKTKDKHSQSSTSADKRSRQDAQLTHMTIFVAVMYSICTVPMLFAYPGLVFSASQVRSTVYIVYAASVNILALSQSAFRFIIYYCFTTQFRFIFHKKFLICPFVNGTGGNQQTSVSLSQNKSIAGHLQHTTTTQHQHEQSPLPRLSIFQQNQTEQSEKLLSKDNDGDPTV